MSGTFTGNELREFIDKYEAQHGELTSKEAALIAALWPHCMRLARDECKQRLMASERIGYGTTSDTLADMMSTFNKAAKQSKKQLI